MPESTRQAGVVMLPGRGLRRQEAARQNQAEVGHAFELKLHPEPVGDRGVREILRSDIKSRKHVA